MHEPARALKERTDVAPKPVPPSHSKKHRRRSYLTNEILSTHVHDALEALLALRDEHGRLTAADVADAVTAHDLDEADTEGLWRELEGLVDDEPELDLTHETAFTTDSLQLFLNEARKHPLRT